MRKMDNRGMMTVEAACIVPIILMIIVIEIFFGIFLIDMSSVKSETIRLADETADVWKTDGNLIDGTYKPQQLLSRNKNFLRHNNRGQLIGKAKARLTKRISTRLSGTTLCKNAIKKDYNTEIKIKNNAQTDKKTNKNRRGESVRDCGYCKRRDTYLSVKCN